MKVQCSIELNKAELLDALSTYISSRNRYSTGFPHGEALDLEYGPSADTIVVKWGEAPEEGLDKIPDSEPLPKQEAVI